MTLLTGRPARLTGLEHLQAIADGTIEPPPMARLLGFEQGSQSYQIGTWSQPQVAGPAKARYDQVKKTVTVLRP